MNPLYRRRQDWSSYRVYVPPGAQQSAEILRRFLLWLWARGKRGWWYRLAHGQPYFAFEVRAVPGQVEHLWSAPRELGAFLRHELAEAYRPGNPEGVESKSATDCRFTAGAVLRLSKPACFSLSTRCSIGSDLVAALGGLQPGEQVTLQFLLIPLRDGAWKPAAHAEFRRAAQLEADGSTVTNMAGRWADDILGPVDEALGLGRRAHATMRRDTADAVERAQIKEAPIRLKDHAFEITARVVAESPPKGRAVALVHAVTAQFAALDDSNQVHPRRAWHPERLKRLVQARWPTGTGDIWTCAELAAVVGVPGPRQDQTGARILELREPPPAGEITIGYGVHRGQRIPVQLSRQALCQHLLLQGKTGAGKGVFQLGLAVEIARAGLGFSVFFPLRQDAERLMAALPAERLADTIYCEVGHPRWSLPLNLLANDSSPLDQERAVEETMNLLLRLFHDSWGPRMAMILRAALSGAAAIGGHIGDAERILVDDAHRAKCAAKIPNENTRRWLQAWEPGADRDAPLNKLTALTWPGDIAAMVAQPGAMNWADLIRQNRIVVACLNQERAGDLACNLAAGGILNQMIRAVKSIPVKERANLFHLALFDEFRIVADGNEGLWQEGFTQLRQFRFGIGVAGQYPGQLPQKVWQSVSGSVASKIVLWEEDREAEACLGLLGGDLAAKDLAQLPALQGYANVLFTGKPEPDGRVPLIPSGPFTIYAPPFVQPLRDWEPAAEECMARWLRPRQSPKQRGALPALEVD